MGLRSPGPLQARAGSQRGPGPRPRGDSNGEDTALPPLGALGSVFPRTLSGNEGQRPVSGASGKCSSERCVEAPSHPALVPGDVPRQCIRQTDTVVLFHHILFFASPEFGNGRKEGPLGSSQHSPRNYVLFGQSRDSGTFVLPHMKGSKNPDEVETLGKVALKYLSCEEPSCWQIWKQVASDSTCCLKRRTSHFLQGDSLQVSENENHMMNHKGDSSSYLENQEFLILRTQDSCGNTYVSESGNQSRGKQTNGKNNPRICETFMKKSPLSDPVKTDTEQKPCKGETPIEGRKEKKKIKR
eukprot:bmy_15966T0